MKEKLKLFKIEIDDIENIDFENCMLQKIARQCADEMDLKRLELVLNENIITAKDKFTGIHSYMGMRVSLEPLEKDISFIVRPTNEPTYEDLSKENKQLKHILDELEEWAEEQITTIKTTFSQVNGNYFIMNDSIEVLEDTLDKIKELRGDKNV